MDLTTETPKHLIPERPDPQWAAALATGAAVAVVDPVPRRVVFLATVARVTPTGRIVLRYESGGIATTSFRPDGYAHVRRSLRNPWPRYIVAREQPDVDAESFRRTGGR